MKHRAYVCVNDKSSYKDMNYRFTYIEEKSRPALTEFSKNIDAEKKSKLISYQFAKWGGYLKHILFIEARLCWTLRN